MVFILFCGFVLLHDDWDLAIHLSLSPPTNLNRDICISVSLYSLHSVVLWCHLMVFFLSLFLFLLFEEKKKKGRAYYLFYFILFYSFLLYSGAFSLNSFSFSFPLHFFVHATALPAIASPQWAKLAATFFFSFFFFRAVVSVSPLFCFSYTIHLPVFLLFHYFLHLWWRFTFRFCLFVWTTTSAAAAAALRTI